MTKETLERAKTLDENIYYIKKLLFVLNERGLHIYSSISGEDFNFNQLDTLTRNIIMEDMKDTLNQRIDKMKIELDEL